MIFDPKHFAHDDADDNRRASSCVRRMAWSGLVGLLLAGALVPGSARAQAQVSFPDRVCNVRDFGAIGAKLRPDTEAFQNAIDSCSQAGGGTVEVPRGWYLIGPISLKSNVRLNVARYAEIRFETEPGLYGTTRAPVTPEGKGADRALINIVDVSNVAIGGEGLIDGQGNVWWEWIREYWRDSDANRSGTANQAQRVTRPRLILAKNVQNLLIEGVTLANAPSFHIVLLNTDDVTIRGTTITAPANSPNTDGIDPSGSRNVLIEHNAISTGDDIVAIKGTGFDPRYPEASTRNITIRDNRIGAGHGISIGSGTAGGIKHVLIENNVFDGSLQGFRIKTRRRFGGEVSDIVFRNNSMVNVSNVLTISSYFNYAPLDEREAQAQIEKGGFLVNDLFYPPDTDPAQPVIKNETPVLHDITIQGLTARGADNAGLIIGLPESEIERLSLDSVTIEAERGFVVRNADVLAKNVQVRVKQGLPFVLQRKGRVAFDEINR